MLKKIDERLARLNDLSNNECNVERLLVKQNIKSANKAYFNGRHGAIFSLAIFPSLCKVVKNALYFAASLIANVLTLGLNNNLRKFCWNKLQSLFLNICNTVIAIFIPLSRWVRTMKDGYSSNKYDNELELESLMQPEALIAFNTFFKPNKFNSYDSKLSRIPDYAAPINAVDSELYNMLTCR